MKRVAVAMAVILGMNVTFCSVFYVHGQNGSDSENLMKRFQATSGSHYIGSDDLPIKGYKEIERKTQVDGILKLTINYKTLNDIVIPAIVYIPVKRYRNMPAVLCLPDYTKTKRGDYSGDSCIYAVELANRGYVTLVPDYPGYGKYNDEYNPYIVGYDSYTMNAIHNHEKAVSLMNSFIEAHSVPELRIDYSRIGCMGHASGGYNALFLSLFARQIKVYGISGGITTFAKYNGGLLGNWSKRHMMPWIASKYDNDPKKLPFDFPELLGSIAPKPLYVSCPSKDDEFNYEGAKECVAKAREAYAKSNAANMFVADFPECGQEFPKEVRERMYDFFDKHLQNKLIDVDKSKPK